MKNINRESGFSFVELLLTMVLLVVLAGLSMAVYTQYQARAYNSTALQQGLQMRTAFEAGLATQSSAAAAILLNTFNITYQIDGDLSCVGCAAATPVIANNGADLLAGFEHMDGVSVSMQVSDATQGYTINAGHCKAMLNNGEDYDGWVVSDQQASYRLALSAPAGAATACAVVMNGADFS
jgi:type II secretory pathway pseudopilin PulG